MNIALTFALFGFFFTAMAIGVIITGKSLKKGCGDNPHDCACRKEGKSPEDCNSS